MDDDDVLRYDILVETALREVVRQALKLAADNGLPGDHHFYITFRTDHAGVEIPDFLRERYPEEMTIVLQHQFWDLKVEGDGFSVALTFNDVPATLNVPLDAISAFADPSVRFGLQFEGMFEEDHPDHLEPTPRHAENTDEAAGATGGKPAKDGQDGDDSEENVVSLDRFRDKKNN